MIHRSEESLNTETSRTVTLCCSNSKFEYCRCLVRLQLDWHGTVFYNRAFNEFLKNSDILGAYKIRFLWFYSTFYSVSD